MRAGVQVSSDPVEYDFNEFTAWKVATAVVTEVPSPPRKYNQSQIAMHVDHQIFFSFISTVACFCCPMNSATSGVRRKST